MKLSGKYKIPHKSIIVICTSNEKYENRIKKIFLFTLASKRTKYIGQFNKNVQDSCKPLLREIKGAP